MEAKLDITKVLDDRSFEAGGRTFKLNKIDTFKQFHIVRRIGPLLSELVKSASELGSVKMDGLSEQEKLEQFAKLVAPIMSGMSKLSDQDADYVFLKLLQSVEVHQTQFNTWARIATDSAIAMQDVELPTLLQCAGKALMYNLSGFFALLPRR